MDGVLGMLLIRKNKCNLKLCTYLKPGPHFLFSKKPFLFNQCIMLAFFLLSFTIFLESHHWRTEYAAHLFSYLMHFLSELYIFIKMFITFTVIQGSDLKQNCINNFNIRFIKRGWRLEYAM